jgi:hypothetical protein
MACPILRSGWALDFQFDVPTQCELLAQPNLYFMSLQVDTKPATCVGRRQKPNFQKLGQIGPYVLYVRLARCRERKDERKLPPILMPTKRFALPATFDPNDSGYSYAAWHALQEAIFGNECIAPNEVSALLLHFARNAKL